MSRVNNGEKAIAMARLGIQLKLNSSFDTPELQKDSDDHMKGHAKEIDELEALHGNDLTKWGGNGVATLICCIAKIDAWMDSMADTLPLLLMHNQLKEKKTTDQFTAADFQNAMRH